MKKLIFGFIALSTFSCNNNSPELELSGTFPGLSGQTIYLQKFQNNAPLTLDSAVIDEKGEFEISAVIPQPDFYQISTQQGGSFVFIAEPGNEISFQSQKDLSTVTEVKGSGDTRLLMDFTNKFNEYMVAREQLYTMNKDQGTPQAALIDTMNAFDQQILDWLHNFIEKNKNSPASLAALSKLNPVQDLEYFKKVQDGIAEKMRMSAYYTFLENQIMQAEQQASALEQQKALQEQADKNLPQGAVAPEITLPDPTGKVRSLSDLRGQVVLIDFWASWCRPCRAENPNVVRAYNDFKDKGFTVFSVSLDKNAEAWKNAIREDRLQWTHVSDLKFWDSEAAKLYGVNSIPFAVLIDKEGKIIDKNLRGEALRSKLKEILG